MGMRVKNHSQRNASKFPSSVHFEKNIASSGVFALSSRQVLGLTLSGFSFDRIAVFISTFSSTPVIGIHAPQTDSSKLPPCLNHPAT